MTPNITLRPNQRRAIEVLVTTGNVTAAAEAAGVTRQTVHRWLRDNDEFKRALALAERAALAKLNRNLLRLSDKAIKALEKALDDDEIQIRLRGADVHLKHLLKYAEIALTEVEMVGKVGVALEDVLAGLPGGLGEAVRAALTEYLSEGGN